MTGTALYKDLFIWEIWIYYNIYFNNTTILPHTNPMDKQVIVFKLIFNLGGKWQTIIIAFYDVILYNKQCQKRIKTQK